MQFWRAIVIRKDMRIGYAATKELIDSFFRYINMEFAGRKKYITLFGGEPLLTGESYFNGIKLLFEKAREAGLEVAIVTNGYTFRLC